MGWKAPHAPKSEHAFEAWEEQVCRTFVPLRAYCADGAETFSGVVDSALLGSVLLTEVSASHALVERTPRLIRCNDPELYKFSLQVSGTSVIEQDEARACLRPGDLAIYDTSRPYRITLSDDFRAAIAMFPRSLVRLPAQQMAAMTALRLSGDTWLGALIAPLMKGIRSDLDVSRTVTATHLGDAVVDLVNAVFAEQLDQPLDLDSPASYRLLAAKVRKYVDDHLSDHDLSSKTVADAHFVSVRYLQKVFASEGSAVSTLIRTRRLERCRRDLADPHCRHLSIAQIGCHRGFPDAAHFSRLFREAYGLSPREFRKALFAA